MNCWPGRRQLSDGGTRHSGCGESAPPSPNNTREPARSGKKKPQPGAVGVSIGGGGGSRTRVRRRLTSSPTCLAHRWISFAGSTVCEARRKTSLLYLTANRQATVRSDPVMMTLHPRAQAQVGSGLRLKRRERSCRRWQLKVCDWIYEESHPLGMHQTISLPPSKP